jgi:H+/Cl- antiporter ClcA
MSGSLSKLKATLLPCFAAAIIGILAALVLLLFEGAAHKIEHALWHDLPDALDISHGSGWWTLAILVTGGFLVALVLKVAPGHGGHEPATESLFGEPLPVAHVPGLLVAALISLSFGASLGPEAPLLGTATAVLAWAAARRNQPAQSLTTLGVAGLLGAMFGAPVGATFAFIELMPLSGKELYDKLVPLFVAATSGALTITLVATRPQFFASFPDPRDFIVVDVASAAGIGIVGAFVGLGIGWCFRNLHVPSQRIPLLIRLVLGGLLLGIIAVIAGDLVLFSGQRELDPLIAEADLLSDGDISLLFVGKVLSLVIAVLAGFRGGKIFPAVFVGMSLGVLIHALVPGIPLVLACGAATVGIVVALIRVWLLTLLLVAMIVGFASLPLLGVALIAAHLIVANAPEPRAGHVTHAG